MRKILSKTKHGIVRIEVNNGTIVEGTWLNDEPHGLRRLIHENESVVDL